jgi:hypothetical protein
MADHVVIGMDTSAPDMVGPNLESMTDMLQLDKSSDMEKLRECYHNAGKDNHGDGGDYAADQLADVAKLAGILWAHSMIRFPHPQIDLAQN